ncbi:MAG: 2,5-dioxovalerate dehydrogenase [Bacteroides sp. SM23_62_1]|nr:MAG: 2,5-dioxovalerate dehydrogenase [Bacteroides sp. SM23_62_1]
MELTGLNFIGNELSGKGKTTFQAFNPDKCKKISPLFCEATRAEINKAVHRAETAFREYSQKSGNQRASLLETIAHEILDLGDKLIDRCCEETGLPVQRLTGERGRLVNQLKLFADLLREGSWVDARIDHADPERQPVPRPDIRSMHKPLGPVGIFGASNFPLAFSVAGGDTTSVLAAGCSVVIKAHPAHPGTSEMVAQAIRAAINKTNMPDGLFSMIHGQSTNTGMAVVRHPNIKAIGFTGSFRGGKAIFDASARRPEPIPVYAEMSSTNPVYILPGALHERMQEISKGLTASVTLGVGQFCTNPGLVVMVESKDSEEFLKITASNFQEVPPATMLTPGIFTAYQDGIHFLTKESKIRLLAISKNKGLAYQGPACLLQTTAEHFLTNEVLENEVFGPSTLIITAKDKTEVLKISANLKGHLTTTLHATDQDLRDYDDLINILERKAGRLIINGFPTGVEVCHAMVHGGPFPATTDSRTTSVGTAAITRFTRPVCYQNFPDNQLPDELKEANPLNIWRLVDGERKKGRLSASG